MSKVGLTIAKAARKAGINMPIIRCGHCAGEGRVPLPIHLHAVWLNLSEKEPRTASEIVARIGGSTSVAGVLYQLRTLVGMNLIYTAGKQQKYRCKPADLWLRKPLLATETSC